MSDDSDDNDRGLKDNTSPEPKPKHIRRPGFAPGGSIGRKVYIEFTPETDEMNLLPDDPAKFIEHHQDQDKPYALKTDIPEIDEQSIADGYRLITDEEIAKSAQSQQEQEEVSQPVVPFGQFIETDDPVVNAYYQKENDMISREDAKAEEIARAWQRSRDRDSGRER